jgi:uroporphyrinogen decarboxylase
LWQDFAGHLEHEGVEEMGETLTHRERWLRVFHYQPVDHVPDEEFGYWDETYTVWHQQGLPEWVRTEADANKFFGFAPRAMVPIHLDIHPWFEAKVLEETDRYRIIVDHRGVKSMVYKDGKSTIPRYLEFPIKTRADWEEFKKRLDPTDPVRYPANWEEWKQKVANRDYPLGIFCGSLFGWLRDWMGLEGIAIACIEEPTWVEEMMEYLTEFFLAVIKRAVEEVQLDFAHFWEDMAYNKGPLISPRLFRQWMTPRYKRITDFLKKHGIDIVVVDCDGNILELIPHWLEGGVNVMFPLEVRAGSDPVLIRKKFGKEVLLMGGVDKTKLIAGKEAIVEELKRIAPVVEEGGYIPHVDHRCPPDVTYENYLFYLETKRRMFGIPDPPHWEQVKETLERAKRSR